MSARSRRALRDNGIGIAFGLLFLAALALQAAAGFADFTEQRLADHLLPVSFGRYLTSSAFAVDVAENWQSEYLQFFLYVFATTWLVQRGSPESKPPGSPHRTSNEQERVAEHAEADSPVSARAGHPRRVVFSVSLGATMGLLFLGSWAAQFIAGRSAYNAQQLAQLQDPLSWSDYLMSPDFWNRTAQNWQSEFLAIGSMAVFAVFLRQRGSPESKAVGAPHDSQG